MPQTRRGRSFLPTFCGGAVISIDALNWAIAQELKPSSSKFVLLSLADVAQESDLAFPSLERVERFTSLNRKTVISALADLVAKGVIRDTGRRVGRTSQVKVYELIRTSLKYVPCVCTDPKTGLLEGKSGTLSNQKRNGSETGTLPEIAGAEAIARGVLEYLNKVASTRYHATPTNLKFILDRLAEGYTPIVLKLVAYHRLVTWRDDPKMRDYLRPATIYNGEKCNQYAGQVPAFYFVRCFNCERELLPGESCTDTPACCVPTETIGGVVRKVEPRAPMPEHMRRLEGESALDWMRRIRAPAGAPA